jgi:hypothetical protein
VSYTRKLREPVYQAKPGVSARDRYWYWYFGFMDRHAQTWPRPQ